LGDRMATKPAGIEISSPLGNELNQEELW